MSSVSPAKTPFLWGAATAAHQVEGGNSGNDIWQMENLAGGAGGFREPSGDAMDHYHRYPQDIGLLAGAGLNAYRCSVEWARIEPEPGVFSAAARTGKPVIVTENGIAASDDAVRIAYTQTALEGLARARADGVEARGYLHWSALDNFEWMHGYGPTIGLIGVDRQTFQRTPKPSLAWLGARARAQPQGPV